MGRVPNRVVPPRQKRFHPPVPAARLHKACRIGPVAVSMLMALSAARWDLQARFAPGIGPTKTSKEAATGTSKRGILACHQPSYRSCLACLPSH